MNNKIVTFKKQHFKSFNLFIYHSLRYDFKKAATLILLSDFIGVISKNYPDKTSMLKFKDLLYSAFISSSNRRINDTMTLHTYYSFVSPSYIDDMNIQDMINFIDETLYNLDLNEKFFEEFKKQNIEQIRRILDKPNQKSIDRIIELISFDQEEFIHHSQSYLSKTFEDISLDDIKEVYEEIKNNTRTDVYLYGRFEDDDIQAFSKYQNNDSELILHKYNPIKNYSYKEYEEESPFTQSYLYYVLNNHEELNEYEENAFIILCMMYGISPSSLLFRELRENRGLCYNCGIRNFKAEGLIMAYAYIDADNKDIAIEEMKKQFNRIKNNDFDIELFETCKHSVIEAIKGYEDDPSYIVNDYHYSLLSGKLKLLDEKIKDLEKVKVEDVVKLANKFNDYMIYFSKGKGDE